MTYAHTTRCDCLLYIVGLEITALSSMIHLSQSQLRASLKNCIYYFIPQGYTAVFAFFL